MSVILRRTAVPSVTSHVAHGRPSPRSSSASSLVLGVIGLRMGEMPMGDGSTRHGSGRIMIGREVSSSPATDEQAGVATRAASAGELDVEAIVRPEVAGKVASVGAHALLLFSPLTSSALV